MKKGGTTNKLRPFKKLVRVFVCIKERIIMKERLEEITNEYNSLLDKLKEEE